MFESNDEVKAQVCNRLKELVIGKPSVADHGNADWMTDVIANNVGRLLDDYIFELIALSGELRFAERFP